MDDPFANLRDDLAEHISVELSRSCSADLRKFLLVLVIIKGVESLNVLLDEFSLRQQVVQGVFAGSSTYCTLAGPRST